MSVCLCVCVSVSVRLCLCVCAFLSASLPLCISLPVSLSLSLPVSLSRPLDLSLATSLWSWRVSEQVNETEHVCALVSHGLLLPQVRDWQDPDRWWRLLRKGLRLHATGHPANIQHNRLRSQHLQVCVCVHDSSFQMTRLVAWLALAQSHLVCVWFSGTKL